MKPLITCLAILFHLSSANAASFDCSFAKAANEKAICENPELSLLDERMAKSYRSELGKAANPQRFQSEQRAWLSEVRQCASIECIRDTYQTRLKLLEGISSASDIQTHGTNLSRPESRLASEPRTEEKPNLPAATSGTLEQLPVPPWSGGLLDVAGLLTQDDLKRVESRIRQLNQKGLGVAILVVKNTGSEKLEVFARRVAESWRLGINERPSGALIVVATENPSELGRLRIELSRSANAVVSNEEAGGMVTQLGSAFSGGRYGAGLETALTRLASRLEEPAPAESVVYNEPIAVAQSLAPALAATALSALTVALESTPAPSAPSLLIQLLVTALLIAAGIFIVSKVSNTVFQTILACLMIIIFCTATFAYTYETRFTDVAIARDKLRDSHREAQAVKRDLELFKQMPSDEAGLARYKAAVSKANRTVSDIRQGAATVAQLEEERTARLQKREAGGGSSQMTSDEEMLYGKARVTCRHLGIPSYDLDGCALDNVNAFRKLNGLPPLVR